MSRNCTGKNQERKHLTFMHYGDIIHCLIANCSQTIDMETIDMESVSVSNILLYRSPTKGRFHSRPNALKQNTAASNSSGF